ncbi:MAG: Holliday junction branch migration protein RuvA [Holophagales bacterium]|nr:Holliday junction branch migration protein RuvA [Holophagales bacterium]
MIGRLSGIVLEKRPDRAVVDASGVGYELHVPLGTFASLPGIGERASLHVHTHVREDAILLFGFTTAEEKVLFERLITVSGIGPKLALVVLSGLPLPELVGAIAAQNVARLSTIPGVGKKLAERLGVELKDKVSGILSSSTSSTVFGVPTVLGGFLDDAVGALVNLGYRKPQAEAAVKAASDGTAPADLPALLSAALRLLSR